jgi:hypothetical protein
MFETLLHIRVSSNLAPRIRQGLPLGSGDKLVGVHQSEEGCLDMTFYVRNFAIREEQAKFLWHFYGELPRVAIPGRQNGEKTLFQFWTSASLPPVQYVQALTHPSYHQRLRECS